MAAPLRFKPLHSICRFKLFAALHHVHSLSNYYNSGEDFVWEISFHIQLMLDQVQKRTDAVDW